MEEEKLLERVDQVLKSEGEESFTENKEPKDLIENFILPGLYNSKNTLASLYKFIPKQKSGFLGKFKNVFLVKVKNVVLNVVERESMRQQKFNELTYQAILNLQEEVKLLRKEIENKK